MPLHVYAPAASTGLEIMAPHQNEANKAKTDKYFGTSSIFRKVGSAIV